MSGVLVAIDWENIRRALPNFKEQVGPEQVCKAFEEVATRFGDYRGGTVFGDWTLRPDDARAFEDHGLQAYNVLRSRSGKDRSDPAIILEVYDWVRDRIDINTFVLGSGDSDFKELIRRARHHGKKVAICALGNTIASELKTMTPIFPLEAELSLTPKTLLTPSLPGFPKGEEVDRWKLFINRLDSVERQLPYIVLNYLKTIVSPAWGVGVTESEKDAYLQDAISEGVVEVYEVVNPKLPGRTTSAIRLNREHEIVRRSLA